MDNPRLQPVGPAFARTVRRLVLAFAAVSVALFGLVSRHLLGTQSLRELSREALVCTAALTPGRDGDLSDAVATLQSRSDRVIAIATLDSTDNLHSVYPDRPAQRSAVLSALTRLESPVTTVSPITGEPISATGFVIPLNGSSSPFASKVLILLQADSYRGMWLGATAIVALIVGIMALVCARLLSRWFDRQVARPLHTLAGAVHDPKTTMEGLDALDLGGWRETGQIAHGFENLINTLSDSDARTRRLERDAQIQIRRTEVGFGQQLRRAKDRASTDPLTGLRNRAFLEEHLEPLYQQYLARNAELSAVMIDVDNFKNCNDTLGHQVGDALLRFIGQLFRGSLRPTDIAVRYGGDEFLLLLPDAAAGQAAVIAERLVKLFGQYAGRLGRKDAVSMSAGVASLRADGCESGHGLIKCADVALYSAKRNGKNMVATSAWSNQSPTTPIPVVA